MNLMKSKSLFKYIGLSIILIVGSCIEEQDIHLKSNMNFEVTASVADVKTTNSGMSTVWVKGDAIGVFHSEKGKNKYVDDGKFVIEQSDVSSGVFNGSVDAGSMSTDKLYDWYAIYPYYDIDAPDDGLVLIGNVEPQKQVGVDDMRHLAGENVPMYGKLTSIPFQEKPSFNMHHLSAVVEIKVNNKTSQPIDITNISIAAPENIIGEFIVDITGDEILYEDGKNVSSVAELNVTEATIPAAKTSSFFIVVKPFAVKRGEEMNIVVNDMVKSITFTDNVSFAEGNIKTINFSYDSAADKYVMPIVEWGVSKETVKDNYGDGFVNIESTDDCLIYKDTKNDYMISYSFNDDLLSASCVIIPKNSSTEKLVDEWLGEYAPVNSTGDDDIFSSEDCKTLITITDDGDYYSIGWSQMITRGFVNGHEYVDLGLSVRWATCNVGAGSPEEYGGYYAWGETKEKDIYDDDTYEYQATFYNYDYYDDSSSYYTAGKFLGYDISSTKYDVASVKWKGGWRMPTAKEVNELMTLCHWEEAEINGVEGSLATGPNGNSVFFPSGGEKKMSYFSGGYCHIWSSTYLSEFRALELKLFPRSRMDVGDEVELQDGSRDYGYNVRAVID